MWKLSQTIPQRALISLTGRLRTVRGLDAILRSSWRGFATAMSLALAPPTAGAQDGDGASTVAAAVARGAYILRAGGCVACHTATDMDGPFLAGGAAIETPFGRFYAPNITPDREHGIGRWTEADFTRAMTQGRAPDSTAYYPVFPYPTYTRMSAGDIADLWAYLQTVPGDPTPRRQHEVAFPFSFRWLNQLWQTAFFHPGPFRGHHGRDPVWNRGAYLAEALGHCGTCHTPRNLLGGPQLAMVQAGTRLPNSENTVPNITPDSETGIGDWSEGDIVWLLKMGFRPDGNDVQGTMAEVIEHSTSHLSNDDLKALATYLRALPPVDNPIRVRPTTDDGDTGDAW